MGPAAHLVLVTARLVTRCRTERLRTMSDVDAGTRNPAPTRHAGLVAWVGEIAALTKPDRVYWCDGSDEEWERLTTEMVASGTLKALNPAKRPNSFYAASDPKDVARVESRTFICSQEARRRGSRPTTGATRRTCAPTLNGLFDGCMRGPHDVCRAVLHGPARLEDQRPRRRDHRQPLCRRFRCGS